MTVSTGQPHSAAGDAVVARGRDADRTATVGVVAKQRINPIAYSRAFLRAQDGEEARFLAAIGQRFGSGIYAFPVGRARVGIYLMTRFAVRDGRRRVLLSPYTIPDVVNMVVLGGGEPVFFDFEPDSTACDLASVLPMLDERTACVLVTHHHLNEPHLGRLATACRTKGIPLYDDCAIAFGGSIDGAPLGTLTDGSVFSFSSFKLLNYFWGGLVTTRDPEFARFIADSIQDWPRLVAKSYARQAKACLRYDLASRPALFSSIVFPMFQRRAQRSGAAAGIENARIESVSIDASLTSRPAAAAFAEWNRKLPHVDDVLAHRRAIARVYTRHLGGRMPTSAYADAMFEGSCFVNFPVLVPESSRDEICRTMMLAGFDVGRNLYPNVHRDPKFSQCSGKSDNVDVLARRLIYLPTHFGVPLAYAEAISGCLAPLLDDADRRGDAGTDVAEARL